MKREKLLKSKHYWLTIRQLELFELIHKFMAENKWSKTRLAEELGVTKSYVTQLLNGNFDHKLSKLIELSLVTGKVPVIKYISVDEIDKQVEVKAPIVVQIFNTTTKVQQLKAGKDYSIPSKIPDKWYSTQIVNEQSLTYKISKSEVDC